MIADTLAITICVCTSGRAFELDRCLASIKAGSKLPREVIVSDDSRDNNSSGAIQSVCQQFAFTRYVKGPCRGLCANRNLVIEAATTSHVSLLDDDATVGTDFIELAYQEINAQPLSIFSGDVLESGTRLTPPTNPTRWGHFGSPLQNGEALRNVNLNCNVFPRAAFADAAFDEQLVYGYEDTDLCDRLVRHGWRIEYIPALCNQHLPPVNRVSRNMLAERERFVVLFRLHSRHGRFDYRSVPWVILAGLQASGAYARRGMFGWIFRLPIWLVRGMWIASQSPVPDSLAISESSDLGFQQQPSYQPYESS